MLLTTQVIDGNVGLQFLYKKVDQEQSEQEVGLDSLTQSLLPRQVCWREMLA